MLQKCFDYFLFEGYIRELPSHFNLHRIQQRTEKLEITILASSLLYQRSVPLL